MSSGELLNVTAEDMTFTTAGWRFIAQLDGAEESVKRQELAYACIHSNVHSVDACDL